MSSLPKLGYLFVHKRCRIIVVNFDLVKKVDLRIKREYFFKNFL